MSAAPGPAAAPMRPRAIVDSHHHFWDLSPGSPVRYAWLGEAGYDPASFILGDYRAICRNFLPADFRAAWGGEPVVATVHVEAECDRTHALAEARWLHDLHRAEGLPSAVVAWVDLLADDAEARLAEMAALPLVRGIRFKPVTTGSAEPAARAALRGRPGALDDARWPAALRRLHRHGLAWDLRVPFWHLEDAATVVRQVPELPVVVEHTGLPWDRSEAGLATWRRGLEALAACPQVFLRLSEFGLKHRPWDAAENSRLMREALTVFGPGRCMFASNFPVASLRVDYPTLVRTLAEALAPWPAAEQAAVWHDNALRFYRIGGA